MGESYPTERAALAAGDIQPAFAAVAAAYKGTGQLAGPARALEEEMVAVQKEAWRELYERCKGPLTWPTSRDRKPVELASFLGSYLTGAFHPSRKERSQWAPLTDAEIDELLELVGKQLKALAAQGRKLAATRLLSEQLDSQRRGLAALCLRQASQDKDNRAAGAFMRAKDKSGLQAVYEARVGAGRPLLTALELDDWEEILRLWLRGWRPAVEAAKVRLAARVDGAPRGGALDLITSY